MTWREEDGIPTANVRECTRINDGGSDLGEQSRNREPELHGTEHEASSRPPPAACSLASTATWIMGVHSRAFAARFSRPDCSRPQFPRYVAAMILRSLTRF